MTTQLEPGKLEEIAINQLFERDRLAREKMERDLNAAHDRLRKVKSDSDTQVAELRRQLQDKIGSKAWVKAAAGVAAWELLKTAGPWILHHFF